MHLAQHLVFLHSLRTRYFFCVFLYVCYYSSFYLHRVTYCTLFTKRCCSITSRLFFFFLFLYNFFEQFTNFFFMQSGILLNTPAHKLLQHFSFTVSYAVQHVYTAVNLAGTYFFFNSTATAVDAIIHIQRILPVHQFTFCGQVVTDHFIPAGSSVRSQQLVYCGAQKSSSSVVQCVHMYVLVYSLLLAIAVLQKNTIALRLMVLYIFFFE